MNPLAGFSRSIAAGFRVNRQTGRALPPRAHASSRLVIAAGLPRTDCRRCTRSSICHDFRTPKDFRIRRQALIPITGIFFN